MEDWPVCVCVFVWGAEIALTDIREFSHLCPHIPVLTDNKLLSQYISTTGTSNHTAFDQHTEDKWTLVKDLLSVPTVSHDGTQNHLTTDVLTQLESLNATPYASKETNYDIVRTFNITLCTCGFEMEHAQISEWETLTHVECVWMTQLDCISSILCRMISPLKTFHKITVKRSWSESWYQHHRACSINGREQGVNNQAATSWKPFQRREKRKRENVKSIKTVLMPDWLCQRRHLIGSTCLHSHAK